MVAGRALRLIFASGVLQWLPDQPWIVTRLVSFLDHGGCLAVQFPTPSTSYPIG